MKFNITSRDKRKLLFDERIQTWHKKFAWKPIRVTEDCVVWLQYYGRRGRLDGYEGGFFGPSPVYDWHVLPLEDALIEGLKGTTDEI